MAEISKPEAEKIWNGYKQAVEKLTAKITTFYEALGSSRTCRHINELWHPDRPAIGIGFVPPEAKDRLESFITASDIHLYKGNGPLGKGLYFSLLYDPQLTEANLQRLIAAVEQETLAQKDVPPPEPKREESLAEYLGDPQLARLEGLTKINRQELRLRPSEVTAIVEAFNGATMDLSPLDALGLLKKAIPYFEYLPEISRKELLRTIAMMEEAELNS